MMNNETRLYRPKKNPGYLMTKGDLLPKGFTGNPASVAKLIGYHITVHIDCDHWWTRAEAVIENVGFAITENEIRQCQNLTPIMMDRWIQELSTLEGSTESKIDRLNTIPRYTNDEAKHRVIVQLEKFDGEQQLIGKLPKQAHIGDRICLPHWGFFFSIWPHGKTQKDGECPQAIYEEGSMRTTVTRPPPTAKIH